MTNVQPTVTTSVRSITSATILRVGLAAVFFGAGCGKILGVAPAVALFHTIGLGEWFRYAIGVIELTGAALLAVPRTARLAALGLIGLMGGAAGTEVLVLHRPPVMSLLTMAALILVARAGPVPRALGFIGALAGAVLGALTGVVLSSTADAQSTTASASPSTSPPSSAPTPASTTSAIVTPTGATKLPPAGSYTYILAADSSDDVRGAVNRTVEPMSFITRPIARGRLNATNPTPQDVKVDILGDTLSVGFDGGTPVVTPLDGATVPWQSSLTHETYQCHATVQGDTVSQSITAPDGVRQNSYLFIDGGNRLRLRVTVTSHRLPGPLVYDLLFRRTPA
jgi:putative oxidoreductase